MHNVHKMKSLSIFWLAHSLPHSELDCDFQTKKNFKFNKSRNYSNFKVNFTCPGKKNWCEITRILTDFWDDHPITLNWQKHG